jgi:hypothetical protein
VYGTSWSFAVFSCRDGVVVDASTRLQILHSTALGTLALYSADVLLADSVPCAHVLLHACAHAAFLAFGKRCSGLGDAALEAVLVKFLARRQYDLDCNAKTACAEQTYLDEHARILHSSFLLDLAHDGRLWVARVRRHAAQGVHVLDCVCGWVSR